MRQRLNPWAVVITAALTFGSLMAFVGPRSMGYHHWGYYDHHYRHHHSVCDGQYKGHDRATEKADKDTSSLQ